MDKDLEYQLSQALGDPIQKTVPLSGGDISRAFLLRTRNARFFCKVHNGREAHTMFLAEKDGLKAIAASGAVQTPDVLYCEPIKTGACLVLEYIEPKNPSAQNMEKLACQLASLHQGVSRDFGWHMDNFIGSLPQANNHRSDWVSFYTDHRLLPQLQLARQKGLLSENAFSDSGKMKVTLKNFGLETKPSLLHGDLWSGNYLISSEGIPYLIDPAVYYGHHEVDIAMTRLFRGFPKEFYTAYEEVFPRKEGWKERQELYQLYYLLVHLNLFGSSYYAPVRQILSKYFLQ